MVFSDYQKIDYSKEDKKYWKHHESRLLKEVKELGLNEDFHHNQPMMEEEREGRDGKMRTVEIPSPHGWGTNPNKWWIGKTTCSLYNPVEFNKMKDFRIKYPNDGVNMFATVGVGISTCSHLDHYNKLKGRVIALERAIWDYLRCPECEVEHLEKGHTGGHMFFTGVKGKILIKKKEEQS